MAPADKASYTTKLKNAGFRAVADWNGEDTDELYNYLRIDDTLYRVLIEPRENSELTEFLYRFNYCEDGEWPSQWTSAGIPAPTFTAMLGKIDMTEFDDNLKSWGSSSVDVKLLGGNLSAYAATLRSNGFAAPEFSSSETWELRKRIQINGKWADVTIENTNNKEIPEIRVYFRSE